MKTHRIAIHLRLATASHRKRMSGIFNRIGQNGAWDVRIVPDERGILELLSGKDAIDGLISCVPYARHTLEALEKSSVPFVGLGMTKSEMDVSRANMDFVANDNAGIGRTAAEHFLSLGNFRSYAFVPDTKNRHWSVVRGETFARTLKAAGKSCRTFASASGEDEAALVRFLADLPKPTAVFVAWDGRAAEVLSTARKADVAVPQEAVVLGVDDDMLICENTVPSLSSIRTDAEGMG